MADVIFNQQRYHNGLGFDWATADVRAAVLLRDTWTPNVDDDYVATATLAGADIRGNRATLTGKTVALDDTNNRALWSAGNIVVSGVTIGHTFNSLLLYTFVTTDADSWLSALWDLGSQTATATTLTFSPDPAGLYAW